MEKTHEDSVCVGHFPCPSCGSRDNLGRYDDGHAYCFGCGYYEKAEGEPAETSKPSPKGDFLQVTPVPIPARKLTIETCEKFRYGQATLSDGRHVQVAPYYDKAGSLLAQHIRTRDKDFFFIGSGNDLPLFGQNLCPPTGRQIVVTEGEIDAMSVSQAFGNRWPVVSLPNGARAAPKAIARALEFLEGYAKVILWFDDDEPGREAAEACAILLTPGKAYLASIPGFKDANEALQAGESSAIERAVWNARAYRPDGIVSLDEIEERVLASPEMGRPWFLPGVTKATFGRRLGELHGFGGGTGCGKTDLFMEQIKFDVMDLAIPCGVLLLEQPVGETGRRLAGKLASKRFHVPDGSWTKDELMAAWGELKATGRLHLYDSFGAMDWPTIEAKMRYMVTVLGCQHIFLDHLTAMAAAADDEKRELEKIMARFAAMTNSLQVVGHYVSHLATPEGKSHEEGGRVQSKHFKGSRAIQFWSHGMWGLERSTQAEDPEERRRTILRCLKDRYTGQALGRTWELHYDPETGRLTEAAERFDEGKERPDF